MSTCGTFVVFICGVTHHNYYNDKNYVCVCVCVCVCVSAFSTVVLV